MPDLPDLPIEILLSILSYHVAPLQTTLRLLSSRQCVLAAVTRSFHQFHQLATPLLYRHCVITRPAHLNSLIGVFTAGGPDSSIARVVKAVTVQFRGGLGYIECEALLRLLPGLKRLHLFGPCRLHIPVSIASLSAASPGVIF
jgi:hypothetical protein